MSLCRTFSRSGVRIYVSWVALPEFWDESAGPRPRSGRDYQGVPTTHRCTSFGGTTMDALINIGLWIVFGLIAGAVAKLLMPGKDPGGIIVTILLGIAGALVGGFIGNAFGFGWAPDGGGR